MVSDDSKDFNITKSPNLQQSSEAVLNSTNLEYHTKRFMTEFASGYLAGSLARLFTHPLDTIKIILQMENSSRPPSSPKNHKHRLGNEYFSERHFYSPSFKMEPLPDPRFKNSIFRHFLFSSQHSAREKFQVLFRGLSAPLVTEGFTTALGIGVYKYTQKLIDPDMQDKKVMFGCAILCGFVSMIPSVPVDVIKIQLQSTAQLPTKNREHFMECVRRIYKQNGFRGFYRGALSQGVHDIPSVTLFFLTYDISMDLLLHRRRWQQDQAALVSGATAGLVGNIFTAPLDILKTRIQSGHSPNILSAYRELRPFGLQAFFAGWKYLAVLSILWNGISFVVYERCVEVLDEEFSRKSTDIRRMQKE